MSNRFAFPERGRRELEALQRLALATPRAISVSGVTDVLAQELTHAVERAGECTISSWDADADTLTNLSVYSLVNGLEESWRGESYPLDDWPGSRVILRSGTSHREYRRSDPSFPAHVVRLLHEWDWASWIAIPLVVENRSVGLIEVVDPSSEEIWDLQDVEFVQTVAAQAAMAVRNAQLSEDLRRHSERDSLTGLLTHTAFHRRLAAELARRDAGRPGAVLVLDVRGLREINRLHGRGAGDAALMAVARGLRAGSHGGDLAARIGGDAFAAALPAGQGGSAAERFARTVAQQAGIEVSIGIADCPPGEPDAASVLEQAERDMAGRRDGDRPTSAAA